MPVLGWLLTGLSRVDNLLSFFPSPVGWFAASISCWALPSARCLAIPAPNAADAHLPLILSKVAIECNKFIEALIYLFFV